MRKGVKILNYIAIPVAVLPAGIVISSCNKDTTKTYIVTVVKKEHITVNSQKEVKEHEDLIITYQTDENYILDSVNITINGRKIDEDTYKINEIEKKITIDKVDISGDIVIALTAKIKEELEDPQEYIWDRTFSIVGIGNKLCYGTGWIYSDATPEVEDDYQYWMVTNMHVQYGMEENSATSYKFSAHTDWKSINSYSTFNSFQYEEKTKFLYTGNLGIDLAVTKVDMKNANETEKNKLNKLNTFQKKHGYITKTAVNSETVHYENQKLYIGGYPYKKETTGGTKWEYHEMKAGDFDYYYSGGKKHQCWETSPYYDVSPQYQSRYMLAGDWMDGGASGSMVIANVREEWNVIGIYWGGWGDEEQTALWPSFSCFNSTRRNFLEKY